MSSSSLPIQKQTDELHKSLAFDESDQLHCPSFQLHSIDNYEPNHSLLPQVFSAETSQHSQHSQHSQSSLISDLSFSSEPNDENVISNPSVAKPKSSNEVDKQLGQINLGRYLQNLFEQMNKFQQQEFNNYCFNPIPRRGSIQKHILAKQGQNCSMKYLNQYPNNSQLDFAQLQNKFPSEGDIIVKVAKQMKRLVQLVAMLKEENNRLRADNAQLIQENEELRYMKDYWRKELLNQSCKFNHERQKLKSLIFQLQKGASPSCQDDPFLVGQANDNIHIRVKALQEINRDASSPRQLPRISNNIQQMLDQLQRSEPFWDNPRFQERLP